MSYTTGQPIRIKMKTKMADTSPPICLSKIIIGDSKLKQVSRRHLDQSSKTHLRTFRGATVAQLTGVIYTGACFARVERVVINISTNDCMGNTVSCSIIADYKKLLSSVPVFPKLRLRRWQSHLKASSGQTRQLPRPFKALRSTASKTMFAIS